MPSDIKSFFMSGPRGQLEALLNSVAGNATHAALVCHPHPLHGGTVHNKVVYHAMKALSAHGFPVLRFNFPGAGRSQGNHDDGRGEVDDARAALDWLDHEFHLPIIAAGFSFGSNVILRASCGDPRVRGCISLGTPIVADQRAYSYGFLKDCAMPKLFVSGSQDHFSPTPRPAKRSGHSHSAEQTCGNRRRRSFLRGKIGAAPPGNRYMAAHSGSTLLKMFAHPQADDMRASARQIWNYAMHQASVAQAFARHVEYSRGVLRVADDLFHLAGYRRVLAISMGKAAHSMAAALVAQTGTLIEGIVAGVAWQEVRQRPRRHSTHAPGVPLFCRRTPAPHRRFHHRRRRHPEIPAHPRRGFAGDLSDQRRFSASVEKPIDSEISLEDPVVETYRVLVHSGAPIAEINAIFASISPPLKAAAWPEPPRAPTM